MIKTATILVAISALFLSSCCTPRVLHSSTEQETITVETVREIEVITEADTAVAVYDISYLLDSIGNDSVAITLELTPVETHEGRYTAPPKIEIKNGKLAVTSTAAPPPQTVQANDTKTTTTITKTETVEVNRLTIWQKIQIGLGWVSTLILVALLIFIRLK